jgi:hypothetical protein
MSLAQLSSQKLHGDAFLLNLGVHDLWECVFLVCSCYIEPAQVWTVMAAHLLLMLVLVFSGTDGKELPSKCVLLSLCNVVDMYCPVDERFLSVK